MRVCPVTGSRRWEPFFYSKTNKIMTGDQRICKGTLRKVICPDSGVVANEGVFTQEDIELLYGNEYELNTLGKEEHFFFTKDGAIARSQVFFDWIYPQLPERFDKLIEIGCGEGNLLQRFTKQFPDKDISGLDGSCKATSLARAKGLNVEKGLIVDGVPLSKADVFLLVNVVEHVENIESLISCLKNSLASDGRIIFCLPIQDYGGYDIFFAEHVWHFTVEHFKNVLRKNGLKLLHFDAAHPINHGIGLFVCTKAEGEEEIFEPTYSDALISNLRFWDDSFKKLDSFLDSSTFEKIAIFGAGEVATLFLTFSSLGERNIVACLDDSKGAGENKHGIPIHNSDWLSENRLDLLLLSVNRKYHGMIMDRFQKYKINILPIY